MTPSEKPSPTRTGGWRVWSDESQPIRLGVSACLMGESVRYDGSHQRNRFLADELGRWVEFVRVCPEVEVGLGIPRPTLRLFSRDGVDVRLVMPKEGRDLTDEMNRYAAGRVRELAKESLDGFVLKKGSPSCGMSRIKIYGEKGSRGNHGVGLFAAALMERMPNLPVEEEGRLNDQGLRESFIERVFARHRWRLFRASRPRGRDLVEFHTAHKLLIRAHNEAAYRRMGRLVAQAGGRPTTAQLDEYEQELFTAMATRATRKRHTNVLQHALGYLKELLDSGEKRELLEAVEDYRKGLLPLVVPVSLIRFQVRAHDVEYLQGQLYFDPHPKELMLRNHA